VSQASAACAAAAFTWSRLSLGSAAERPAPLHGLPSFSTELALGILLRQAHHVHHAPRCVMDLVLRRYDDVIVLHQAVPPATVTSFSLGRVSCS